MADRPQEESGWERGFDGHRRAQHRRFRALSIDDKLRWLEEAQRFVREIQRARERKQREDAAAKPE